MNTNKRFEQVLCDALLNCTGSRFKRKDILVWSLSKSWIESMANEHERAVFVPQLEVWCLVRTSVSKARLN